MFKLDNCCITFFFLIFGQQLGLISQSLRKDSNVSSEPELHLDSVSAYRRLICLEAVNMSQTVAEHLLKDLEPELSAKMKSEFL